MRFYCNSLESLLLFTDNVKLFRVANVVISALPSLAQFSGVEQSVAVSPLRCKTDQRCLSFPILFFFKPVVYVCEEFFLLFHGSFVP